MFTPFMKNTLLSEKRSCSRMSLQRQMFTPFMKNTLFFEKRRCSRMSLQNANVHPFYEEYTLLREEEV